MGGLAINTLRSVTNVPRIRASAARAIAQLTELLWVPVCSIPWVTEAFAPRRPITIEHQILRIVKVGPTFGTRVHVSRFACLAWVFALSQRVEREIVQLINDVGLSRILVSLDDKAVTWPVVRSVTH